MVLYAHIEVLIEKKKIRCNVCSCLDDECVLHSACIFGSLNAMTGTTLLGTVQHSLWWVRLEG